MRHMGRKAHAFLTASHNNIGVAKLNVLGAKCDSPKAGAADLIYTPSSTFLRQARVNMRLSCGILTLSGAQNLTHDRLRDVTFVDACTLYRSFDYRGSKIMCRCICKAAEEGTYGGSCCRGDDYVCHLSVSKV